ncbi:MAG: hypothetical protein LBB36_03595, partial [Fibromonadaceae bacterium]|nr:hypothetical protein [Fibromonadaceae bacterium]
MAMLQEKFIKSITRTGVIIVGARLIAPLLLFTNTALALDRVGAVFVYEYAKLYALEQNFSNVNFNAVLLFQNPLSLDWDGTEIKSDGGKVFLFNAKFPFDAGFATLTPHFSYGSGVWRSGDFYRFYGKPHLPGVSGFGMCAGRGGNSLGAAYYFGEAKILNNEDEDLFSSDFYLWNVFYGYA